MRPSLVLSVLAPLAWLASVGPAHAFGPTDHVHQGQEPQRVYRFDADTQRTLRESLSWQAFTQGPGQGWTVRFDEETGEPLRTFGRGIDLGPVLANDAAAVDAVRGFLGRHAQAFSTSPRVLGQGSASYHAPSDTWYVDLPAVYEGAPVYRGGVTARIQGGRLVMIGVQTYAGVERLGQPVLSAEDAVQTAADLGPASSAVHQQTSAELVWLPWHVDGELVLVRAWEVHSVTDEPLGEWVSFVDAETGELLNVHNQVRFIDGTVQARVNPRRADDPLVTVPIKDAWITGDGRRERTDADGRFSIEATSYELQLRGDDLILRDELRGSNVPTFRDLALTDVLLTSEVVPQAALNTWVGIQDVQDYFGAIAPDIEVGGRNGNPLTANVNVGGGTCNAFYSSQNGSVNFYRTGGGCNNSGLIADIIYHEWGHGFHAWSLRSGSFDGSLSEGAADTVAFLLTNHHIIGPSFRTDGGGIRNVEPDRRYPENYSTRQAVHTNGLIFAGAMWDLVRELEGRYSREQANEVVAGLLAGALRGGPGIATVGEEVLLADDDDGDLSNGTPHYCEIVAAFEPHGLVPELALEVAVDHEQLVEAEPQDLVVTASGGALDLSCIDLSTVQVVYRADGGSWQSEPMDRDGVELAARLDLPYGTFVEYYLDTGGAQIPGGGVTNPLSLYVGGVLDVYKTDFEADDGGFTSELLEGDPNQAGANDWQWGTPNATPANGQGGTSVSGDPDGAYSGDNAWGNDLGNIVEDDEGTPQYWNGVYQGDRHNRLNSPPLAVPEHLEGVFLRYARWLNVEDGFFDRARILADGDVVWSNYSSEQQEGGFHHEDRRWVQHSVDLRGAADDGEVVLSWEIETDQGLHLAGWNIDDVALYAPATPNNRLAITDLVAGDDEDGGVTVTWTNPQYAPLERVIVVRKEGELPTGPSDGEVVFTDDAPELGAPSSTVDTGGKSGQVYWYAAYGDDGTDTLGWTVEGWNADQGSGTGQSSGIAGCSCSTTPSGGHLAWLGLGGLVFLLRRRQG